MISPTFLTIFNQSILVHKLNVFLCVFFCNVTYLQSIISRKRQFIKGFFIHSPGDNLLLIVKYK